MEWWKEKFDMIHIEKWSDEEEPRLIWWFREKNKKKLCYDCQINLGFIWCSLEISENLKFKRKFLGKDIVCTPCWIQRIKIPNADWRGFVVRHFKTKSIRDILFEIRMKE